ncbi:MAG: hypothetical protein FJ288_03800 [Planctomycetes bacterium]|nr:hypothetical protein [Planctomycetota bacterium]
MPMPQSRAKPRRAAPAMEPLEPRLLLDGSLLISEFMASNETTLADAQGEYCDWIEIYNPTASAVDLTGWHLTDNSGNLNKWQFPAGVTIGAGRYLVVFASGKDTTFLVGDNPQYHTNFKLDAGGEYLALVASDGSTVIHAYAPKYPKQVEDVSYGIGQVQVMQTLIAAGATAQTLVPTGDSLEGTWHTLAYTPDGSWTTGPTGAGYDTEPPPTPVSGFRVRMVDTNGGTDAAISNIGEAQQILNGTAAPGAFTIYQDVSAFRTAVNYGFGSGVFSGDLLLPNGFGTSSDSAVPERTQYVLRITATVTIPVGNWTVNVGSDDGFMLTIAGITFITKYYENFTGTSNPSSPDTIVYGAGRSHGNTFGTFTVSGSPLTTTLTLDFFEASGSDDVELSIASGLRSSFSTANFSILADGVRGWGVKTSLAAGPDYSALIGTSTAGAMYGSGKNTTAYVRIPFAVADVSEISSLLLRMKYEDGFVAYINGQEVALANAPEDPAWNSAATADRDDALALAYEDFDVSDAIAYLVTGANVLAIRALNYSSTDYHFLALPVLEARGPDATLTDVVRYFVLPTPGEPNGAGTADLGPVIYDVSHSPAQPTDAQDLVVTALIRETFEDLATSSVTLHYRVMYGTEQAVIMTVYDDGLHGDGAAGDGLYFATAAIPASASTPGQMVRYYVTAEDEDDVSSRWPLYPDPNASARYMGTVVADPSAASALPVFWWFVESPSAAETDAGTKASVYYDGRFYDNVQVELRGGSARNWPKKHFKFKFNAGDNFYVPGLGYVQEFNLNSTYGDKAYIRTVLSWETYRDAGVPYCESFPMRVQQNGAFYSVAIFVEEPEEAYLERQGLDPDGNLYKHLNTDGGGWLFRATNFEKKTGTPGDFSDLEALVAGLNYALTLDEGPRADYLARFIFDNFDVPEVINYLAASTIIHDNDNAQKNYYLYHDPKTGLWLMLPWDKDLTFGRNFVPWSGGVLSDVIWADFDGWRVLLQDSSRTGTSPSHPLFSAIGYGKIDGYKAWNPIIGAFMQVPAIKEKEMYLRRLRTLMDEFLQPPGTPYAERYYETRIDELYALMAPDVALDDAKWGNYGTYQDFATALGILKSEYLDVRRTHLYVNHSTDTTYPDFAGIPAAQPDRSAIQIGVVESSPASGNQGEEYIELVNPNNYAVDISGWKLRGGAEHTFDTGTVIPAGGSLYVTPDLAAFLARESGPRGGRGLFVQGNYNGRLYRGEAFWLLDEGGNQVAAYQVPGGTSDVQQYLRITELMYHPTAPAGGPCVGSDFEFIELRNTSATTTLNLGDVRLADGVYFIFPSWSLAPGAYVLVVADQAAFESRYGTGLAGLIAGEFAPPPGEAAPSRLSNGGEHIRLVDAQDGVILSFDYDDDWYTHTDGLGFSLVIRDPTGPQEAWDSKSGWRAGRTGGTWGGSPGTQDSPSLAPDSIVISELMSHTDAPAGDWVEFYNATGEPISIAGWYLSDDPRNLTKYCIPDSVPAIPAGGYLVLTQNEHFGIAGLPGVATPFAFSELGDAAYLTSGSGGVLGDYQVSQTFGAADAEVSFVRYEKPSGGKDFTPASAATPGTPNAPPAVGPVVINEIMYNPAEGGNEFVELRNLTASDVLLYDPARPANTWKFTQGLPFAFPAGAVVPANGYALVVSIDPAAFRAKYGIPAGVPIYGPYDGRLGGSGESVELCWPGTPEPDGTVPYYRVDRVTYDNSAPWPTLPDGLGPALARIVSAAYGNDYTNWQASHAGGTPGAANGGAADATPPTDPSGLAATVVSTSRIDLSWTGSVDPQTGVAGYLIYRNGAVVAVAAGTTYSDTSVRPSVTYSYQVAAVNGDGTASGLTAAVVRRAVGLASADSMQPTSVQVVFTEVVQQSSAENASNYTVTYPPGGTVTVESAVLGSDGRTVTLTTASALSLGTVHTLTVSGVQGASGYAVVPGSQKTFSCVPRGTGSILWEYWTGISGSYVSDLTGSSNYPSSPSGRRELLSLDAFPYFADNCGTRLRGYVTAPQTGNYTFWIASDDNSELWLNSAGEDPAGAVMIAYVGATGSAQSTNWRQWTKYASQQSAQVWLVAGQRYYIEVRHKEGSSGPDNLSVGWQLPDLTYERPIPASRLSPYILPSSPDNRIIVQVQATDPAAAEAAADKGAFAITRTGNSAALTVYYTVGGTAGGDDYRELLSGWIKLSSGQNSATINVTPIDEAENEADETVILTLLPRASYAIGAASSAAVTIADNEYPRVTAVVLNGRDGRGPSAIDPSGAGVRTIEVRFSEPVTFADADVTVQAVAFPGGVEQVLAVIQPASVSGSGTDTMTISLDPGAAADTWVKVILSGSGTLLDLQGRFLDGEPAASGAGRVYIYGEADLPSGDGLPGGNAVFYVGSLRGDFDADRFVTAADKPLFAAKWRAGDLDADFRGVGFGARPPDGLVTVADINGFTSAYQSAVAAGRHLDELPAGGGLAAGGVAELPTLSGAGAGIELPTSATAGGIDLLAAAAGQVFAAPADAPPSPGEVDVAAAPADEALSLRPVYEASAADDPADVLRI